MTSPQRVALITARQLSHLDDDLPLLVPALEALGVRVEVADWHDETYDWAAVDLAVVRSAWDYTTQLEGFLRRLEVIEAATRLANPLDVVRWNADKRYLVGLHEAGAPVVPTTVIEPGQRPQVPDGVACVVKPTVSAGARDTERFAPDQGPAAVAHAESLLAAGRSVLVQPYVHAIDEAGETGVVYVGDAFSHGFRKGPILGSGAELVEGLYWEQEIEPREPSPAERAVAERVLDAVADLVPGRTRTDLLYARVDLVPGRDGPVLMELELIEPSLFLPMSSGGAERAARAIAGLAAAVTAQR